MAATSESSIEVTSKKVVSSTMDIMQFRDPSTGNIVSWIDHTGTGQGNLAGGGGGSAFNGTNIQTGSYNVLTGDNGKLVVLNSASAATFILPASPPSSTWVVLFQNEGAGTLTVSPNGLNIDGSASNLTLTTGLGVIIFTDGTNYFTERGMGAGGGGTVDYLQFDGGASNSTYTTTTMRFDMGASV